MCECCSSSTLTVVGNDALAAPTAAPVTLTVDRPLTGLAANRCFDLCIPKALLRNLNTSLVQISDGTTTLDLLSRCTDPLRYDSLFLYCRDLRTVSGYVKLRCNLRTEPAPGHVYVKTCLPRTTYLAPAAAADPAAAPLATGVEAQALVADTKAKKSGA